MIDYLNQATVPIAGRVGFVVRRDAGHGTQGVGRVRGPASRFLESLDLDPATLPDLLAHSGVQCRADSMLRSSERAPELAEQLLCDTWVVDTLDVAFDLAAGTGAAAVS